MTNIELGLEDAGVATSSLEDNIRVLASLLSAQERMSAHDRSEMQRTRTLVNRLVRTAGRPLDGQHARASEEEVPKGSIATRAEPAALDDSTYVDFEHRFRGTRDEIRSRQKDAVQFVIGLVGAKAPLLDLGCGRGEWLDLARELDIPAYGVDSNAAMVAEATAAGLDARVEDALGHLAQLEESTLQAVSAFHFVEHVPVDVLVELLDSALVALRPGGTLLLETPNPTNLVVGASSFFLDPTHHRVLHPDFLSFLVESRGYVDVQVHFVHPVVEASVLDDGHIDGLEDSARLRRMVSGVEWALFGPQDYLLTARRAEVAR
ncbi:MAG: class I SAM-dependent methyltransferase [Actinomycetota bacterium]|nr:class I SAM-dependent methyltransferase [Actinomycetota bacterium]